MKENAKILICYNAPVSIFSVYNGKKNDEAAKANDLSENNWVFLPSEILEYIHGQL